MHIFDFLFAEEGVPEVEGIEARRIMYRLRNHTCVKNKCGKPKVEKSIHESIIYIHEINRS